MFWDPTYIIMIPALIFTMIAQFMVSSTFNKYSIVGNRRNLTANEVVRKILDENGLYNISIDHINGNLTDHFDSKNNVIRLSDSVYNSTSVAAIGVGAHEAGHAIQYAQSYAPIKLRAAIIPVTQIGSKLAIPLIILGMIFNGSMGWLIDAGIILYGTVVAFRLITLPVEFNASGRALKILENSNIIDGDEKSKAKKVLTAAAMTYVAALFSAIMSLYRLILISNRNRRND